MIPSSLKVQRLYGLIYLIVAVLYVNNSTAQSSPQNSLYLIDLYSINPAYAGLDRSLSVNFNYRDQWPGIQANPRQLYVNAHIPVYLINGGVGVELSSDQLGPLRFNTFSLSYNRINQTHFGIVSFGGSLGLRSSQLDGTGLITPEGVYSAGIVDHQDPFLSNTVDSRTNLHSSLGIFVGTKKFEVGLSVTNLLLKRDRINDIATSNHDALKLYGQIPFTFQGISFYTSFLVKTNFEVLQTDLSCITKSGNIFGGLSLRGYGKNSLDALVLVGGIKINENYTIGYSYDIGLSSLNSVSQGAHEIHINYNLNKLVGIGLPPEIIYNPRNL